MEDIPKTLNKRRTVSEKLKILEYVEETSIKKAADLFGCYRKAISNNFYKIK